MVRCASLSLGLQHRRLQGCGAGGHGQVLQGVRERGPVGLGHLAGGELGERVARKLTEALGVQNVQRHADDPASWNEPRIRQMKQSRQQLAPRKVAGGTDEHHDLRELRTDT